jgi:hypothetical protein
MNITNQFQQILIFLAQNGFEAVLKKMTLSVMKPVKGNGITSKYPTHDRRNRRCPTAEQQVEMIPE